MSSNPCFRISCLSLAGLSGNRGKRLGHGLETGLRERIREFHHVELVIVVIDEVAMDESLEKPVAAGGVTVGDSACTGAGMCTIRCASESGPRPDLAGMR